MISLKTHVISLGGSLVVPNEIDYDFLKKLKEIITRLTKKNKFVIVVGGGRTARIYINALRKEGVNERLQSLIGIGITRLNARFCANFFGKIGSQHTPSNLKELTNMMRIDKVVFSGGLRFIPNNTSDGTAAQIANHLKTEFINLTNVDGLYSKDPKKFKDAIFIPKISINDFYKIATKMEYKPGQHFVLDQHAAEIIKKHKIRTVILNGKNLNNIENYLEGRKFVGTVIE